MGAVGEGKNIPQQQKKMPIEALRQFRDRFNIPIADDKLGDIPYFKPPDHSPEDTIERNISMDRLTVSMEMIGCAAYDLAN